RVCERCTGAHIQSYCTRRKHSCPIALAPRYSHAFFSGGSACSISVLMATLIGLSDQLARLKSSTTRHSGEARSLIVDLRVTPVALRSRAINALRISRMAVSRKSAMISRGHDASGCDQSMPGQASASSGRIAMIAPMSHGCGSSPVHPDCLLGVELFGGRLLGAGC